MKWLVRLLLLVLLAAAAAAGGVAWWLNQPLALAADSVELSIEQGELPREIAQGWVHAGVQAPPWALYHWFRWSGDAKRIRAGSYEIGVGTTPRELLRKMVRAGYLGRKAGRGFFVWNGNERVRAEKEAVR